MRVFVRVFSPVKLNPMSHIVSPVCLDELSPITSCNPFVGPGLLESRVRISILTFVFISRY